MRPGVRARAWLARWCSEKALRQRIDPTIADLQEEYREAVRHRGAWRARWVWLAGHVALAQVAIFCVSEAMLGAISSATSDDRSDLRRALTATAIVAAVASIIVIAPYWTVIAGEAGVVQLRRTGYLVPDALMVAVPIGLMIGVLVASRGRASRPFGVAMIGIGLVASGLAFISAAWITPASNQAFRVDVIGDVALQRGENELTLFEARRRLVEDSGDSPDPWAIAAGYYSRWALSFTPLVVTAFALSARRRPKAWRAILAAVGAAAFLLYYVPFGGQGELWSLRSLPPAAAAWLPNTLFMVMALRHQRILRHTSSAVG